MELTAVEVLNIIAKSVASIECSNSSKPTQKPSSKQYCESAWNAVAYAESNGFLASLDKQWPNGSKPMSNAHQISETRCSLRHPMTFSNWMKFGALWAKKRIHDGCGRRCAVERAKL